MERNAELLRKVADYIEQNPDRYGQEMAPGLFFSGEAFEYLFNLFGEGERLHGFGVDVHLHSGEVWEGFGLGLEVVGSEYAFTFFRARTDEDWAAPPEEQKRRAFPITANRIERIVVS